MVISCASLALADAGILLYDLITSVSVVCIKDTRIYFFIFVLSVSLEFHGKLLCIGSFLLYSGKISESNIEKP